jgi:hypothetical protein
MQMAQRGKVIKTGGALQVIDKKPYTKRSFSGSTGVYSGGTIKKLIIYRINSGIEPLTTSVSTLTIGKKYRRKASKKTSKKASRKASKRGSIKRKASKRKSSRKASKKGGKVARKKRSFKPIKFKL